MLEEVVARQGFAGAALALVVGGLLLTVCVERLIGYLTRITLASRVSLFALAVVFTGFEVDDTILALVLSAGELEGAALGTALGTGLAIVGVTFALAATVSPFPVDLPRDYLVLFALGPGILVPFALLGRLTPVHGVLLLGASVAVFGYLVVREYRRDTPVFRNSDLGRAIQPDGGVALPRSVPELPEDRLVRGRPAAPWIWTTLAALALAGIVLASMVLESGSEVFVGELGIEGSVFGATVLTVVLTAEDVLLTIEPVRRGVPEIGVGNVIGSLLFSVTANVGVIALVGDLLVSEAVVWFHLPAVVVVTALAAYFLHGGRLERWHGLLFGGLYLAYWLVAVLVFGGVPIAG